MLRCNYFRELKLKIQIYNHLRRLRLQHRLLQGRRQLLQDIQQ
jgi:hypothetical protein